MKEHRMPNYVVPGLMKLNDKTLNIQKVKTRLGEHITTVFESSYVTEVCQLDNWYCIRNFAIKTVGERLSKSRWWKSRSFSSHPLNSLHKFTIDSPGDLSNCQLAGLLRKADEPMQLIKLILWTESEQFMSEISWKFMARRHQSRNVF